MVEWRIRQLDITASTNDDAKVAAELGEAEGLVIHALQQNSGRGRHGRVWESPLGNLYCSVLLRPEGGIESVGYFSFIVALALGATVQNLLLELLLTKSTPSISLPLTGGNTAPVARVGECNTGLAITRPPRPSRKREGDNAAHASTYSGNTLQAEVKLKWPNDVLVNGKKISGILLEAGPGWLVLGMGLNVLRHPENALYPTTSLAAQGITPPPVGDILALLLANLAEFYALYQTAGFAPIRAAWLRQAQTGAMTVRLPQGEIRGEFADLDLSGHLRLRLADGAERSIATGDVFVNIKE